VFMEAFALARPVVSTFVAGIPEIVHPGVSGWLVPAGSTHALAQVLAATPDQLLKMGLAGRQEVHQNYNINQNTVDLARLIRGTQDSAATI